MKSVLVFILMLLLLLLRACGINLPAREPERPVQVVEDDIVDEDADATAIPAQTATPAETPAPVASNTPSAAPTTSPAPQLDYDGSLFGEPDTDF